MKKLIAASFAFLFLLTIVAGCPATSSSPKATNDSGTVNFDDTGSTVTSADESLDDLPM